MWKHAEAVILDAEGVVANKNGKKHKLHDFANLGDHERQEGEPSESVPEINLLN